MATDDVTTIKTSEIPLGAIVALDVRGTRIAVANVGGTYYAFQPNNGNGVHEYAAELAVRYWKEHLEMLDKGKLAKPAFKCGGPENARSWKALVDEFFAGRDLVPGC